MPSLHTAYAALHSAARAALEAAPSADAAPTLAVICESAGEAAQLAALGLDDLAHEAAVPALTWAAACDLPLPEGLTPQSWLPAVPAFLRGVGARAWADAEGM